MNILKINVLPLVSEISIPSLKCEMFTTSLQRKIFAILAMEEILGTFKF